MKVNVLFFGHAKELAGMREFTMVLSEDITLEECKKKLEIEFPKLKLLSAFAFALNKEYVKANDLILTDGDELAILPPVSGG